MTNQQILAIALRQSAVDMNCEPGDFLLSENKIVYSAAREGARAYLRLPFACNLAYYGDNVVASVSPECESAVRAYLAGCGEAFRCFDMPQVHRLEDALAPYGLRADVMARYFLPEVNALQPLPCPFETRLLGPADFAPLYRPEWHNALSEDRPHLDVLGVGAYDGGRLIGLAGCSADCADMWQIGVDVLPDYRRQGVASALTSRLALEIIARGKAPFYCAAWSNIRSARNAVRSGFRPAWVEMSFRPSAAAGIPLAKEAATP
ncbi:MAG: GNAT family N-acetyltransferase [Clostridia bacterium]|nr:GNAT family N-acetyltransferase [Clostridia bacterium]